MQKIAIIILSIFIIGMFIGAADAAHTVTKGKIKVKITNKEYKKLTATKTEYKTVTKTRQVTKYKNVTKTRQVTRTNTTIKDSVKVNTTYYYPNSDTIRAVNKTDEVINLENEGYVRTGDVWTVKYSPPLHTDGKELGYGNITGYVWLTQKSSDDFQNFSKTTYYNETEEYVDQEPYQVTEKYQVKVPYKVRKYATVTKTVPKKYKTVKKAYYVWKTVRSYYIANEWKYVGKSEIFGLQTPAQKLDTQRRVKKIRSNGWKINKNEHRSKYDMVDGGVYRHYYLCTKKVYYKDKIQVKKYKKVKKPVKMRIMSWAQDAAPKGKVWVTLYYGNQLKYGKCMSNGYAKIK